ACTRGAGAWTRGVGAWIERVGACDDCRGAGALVRGEVTLRLMVGGAVRGCTDDRFCRGTSARAVLRFGVVTGDRSDGACALSLRPRSRSTVRDEVRGGVRVGACVDGRGLDRGATD